MSKDEDNNETDIELNAAGILEFMNDE